MGTRARAPGSPHMGLVPHCCLVGTPAPTASRGPEGIAVALGSASTTPQGQRPAGSIAPAQEVERRRGSGRGWGGCCRPHKAVPAAGLWGQCFSPPGEARPTGSCVGPWEVALPALPIHQPTRGRLGHLLCHRVNAAISHDHPKLLGQTPSRRRWLITRIISASPAVTLCRPGRGAGRLWHREGWSPLSRPTLGTALPSRSLPRASCSRVTCGKGLLTWRNHPTPEHSPLLRHFQPPPDPHSDHSPSVEADKALPREHRAREMPRSSAPSGFVLPSSEAHLGVCRRLHAPDSPLTLPGFKPPLSLLLGRTHLPWDQRTRGCEHPPRTGPQAGASSTIPALAGAHTAQPQVPMGLSSPLSAHTPGCLEAPGPLCDQHPPKLLPPAWSSRNRGLCRHLGSLEGPPSSSLGEHLCPRPHPPSLCLCSSPTCPLGASAGYSLCPLPLGSYRPVLPFPKSSAPLALPIGPPPDRPGTPSHLVPSPSPALGQILQQKDLIACQN